MSLINNIFKKARDLFNQKNADNADGNYDIYIGKSFCKPSDAGLYIRFLYTVNEELRKYKVTISDIIYCVSDNRSAVCLTCEDTEGVSTLALSPVGEFRPNTDICDKSFKLVERCVRNAAEAVLDSSVPVYSIVIWNDMHNKLWDIYARVWDWQINTPEVRQICESEKCCMFPATSHGAVAEPCIFIIYKDLSAEKNGSPQKVENMLLEWLDREIVQKGHKSDFSACILPLIWSKIAEEKKFGYNPADEYFNNNCKFANL